MRRRLRLAAVVIALAGAGPASAQQAATWGPPAGPLVSHVVDTNQARAPFSGSATQPSSFSLTGFFSKLNPFKKKPAPANNLPGRAQPPNKNPNPPARVLP